MKTSIKQIIKPENGIEEAIIANPDFVTGVEYGKPRSGHPEGKVLYHIKEVLENIDKWYGDDEEEEGWVEILQATATTRVPEKQFLGDLAHSIRRAGWELGYLKAGRENETDDEGDADDAEVIQLIQEMTV